MKLLNLLLILLLALAVSCGSTQETEEEEGATCSFPAKVEKKVAKYVDMIMAESEANGLDPALVFAFIHVVSDFNPNKVGPNQEVGIMQLTPQTSGAFAWNLVYKESHQPTRPELFSAKRNIKLGCAWLKTTMEKFNGYKAPGKEYLSVFAYLEGMPLAKKFAKVNSLKGSSGSDIYTIMVSKAQFKKRKGLLKEFKKQWKLYKKYLGK